MSQQQNTVYFNNFATTWPKPPVVQQAVQQHLQQLPGNANRGGLGAYAVVDTCRKEMSQFFGLDDHRRLVFTSGSTEALNTVIFGLDKPKHIVSTVTEHNSVIRPLNHLQQEQGTRLSFVPCNSGGFVDPTDVEAAICADTAAVVINHCSNVTGAIQDIASLAQVAKAHHLLFVLDASQSAGAVPINVAELPIDFLIFTAHKNLYGVAGVGGLLINCNYPLRPLKVGGTGAKSRLPFQPQTLPMRYESGTHNELGIAALLAGLRFVQEFGMAAIRQHKTAIHQQIMAGLGQHPRLEFYANATDNRYLPVINFNVKGMEASELAYMLQESFGIAVRAGLHCAPQVFSYISAPSSGTVRVSFSCLNTSDEAAYFVQAMLQILDAV